MHYTSISLIESQNLILQEMGRGGWLKYYLFWKKIGNGRLLLVGFGRTVCIYLVLGG